MTREYFYKNSKGQVVPYHYCSECGKRYTNEEFNNNLIVNVGTSITPIKYCVKTCLDLKFPDQKPQGIILPKKLHDVDEGFEEIIPKEMEPEKLLEDSEVPPEEVIEEIEPIIEKVIKKIKPTVKEIEPIKSSDSLEEDLNKLSAKQIIEKVKAEKGIEITGDLKSKKMILRRALKAYKEPIKEEMKPSDTPSLESAFNKMSAKQIVEKVKAEKGIAITCSIKSKKVIVKQALKIYLGVL